MTIFSSVGYGDLNWGTNGELAYQILAQLIGIGIFGYIYGSMSNIAVKADNANILKEIHEEDLNEWLIKLSKSNKTKIMSHEYFNHISKFYNNLWNRDYQSIQKSKYFNQLKPSLKDELLDHLFSNIYNDFESFFRDHDPRFCREIVKEMQFQTFELFPLYMEKYNEDTGSIPPIQPRILLEKGKVPFAVFFIVKGEVYAGNTTGKYMYFKFSQNSVMGETHLISGLPYSYSVFHHEAESVSAFVIPGKVLYFILLNAHKWLYFYRHSCKFLKNILYLTSYY